jgi:hypothetical protein
MIETSTVAAALAQMQPSLGEDGFALSAGAISESGIEVVLTAQPDACLDCLVPDDMMVAMLRDAISEQAQVAEVGQVTLTKKGFEDLHP